MTVVTHEFFQFVEDDLFKSRVDELLVRLALEHRDEDFGRPPAHFFLLTCQIFVHNLDHPWTDLLEQTVRRGTDHVKHDSADTNSVSVISHLVELLFKNIEGSVDNLFSELLDKTTHAR